MSLLTKGGGITKLSELTIDADKDWQAMGISNLEELALGMARGDFAVRGATVLQRLQPSTVGYVLTSAGLLHIPSWQPAPGPLLYYFPVPIDLSHAEAIVPVNQSYNKNAQITSAHAKAYDDQPALNIKRLTPTVTLNKTHVIVPVDQSYNKNAAIGREGGMQMLVDGAVADDGGVQTDETAAARNATANDMTLLPVLPVVNDAYYCGLLYPSNRVWLNIGTAGNGNWAFTEEYWNGAWVALAGVDDQTNEFTLAGLNKATFTKPGDWALTNILGMNLYWMRFRVSAFVSIVTQPLGTQAWCEVLV